MKRPTIYDIAREAGVSAATVSYVINGRSDQKISDATKKKVMQIANLLGYSRNQSAYTLATGDSKYIACHSDDLGPLGDAETFCFVKAFAGYLSRSDKKLAYFDATSSSGITDASALVLRGVSSERFQRIADTNMVPVLALDAIVDNPLFYCVNTDYRALRNAAAAGFDSREPALIVCNTPNEELKAHVQSVFRDVRFVKSFAHAASVFSDLARSPAVVVGRTLGALADQLSPDNGFFKYDPNGESKLAALAECVRNCFDRVIPPTHKVFVL